MKILLISVFMLAMTSSITKAEVQIIGKVEINNSSRIENFLKLQKRNVFNPFIESPIALLGDHARREVLAGILVKGQVRPVNTLIFSFEESENKRLCTVKVRITSTDKEVIADFTQRAFVTSESTASLSESLSYLKCDVDYFTKQFNKHTEDVLD